MFDIQEERDNWKMQQQGDRGAHVMNLQTLLVSIGYAAFQPNGVFGPQTDAAVRRFQSDNGLVADGKVGVLTFDKIADKFAPQQVAQANTGDQFMTAEHLVYALGLSTDIAAKVVGPINNAIAKFNLNSVNRMCSWLANICHESGKFEHLKENLNYSAEGLARVWPRRFAVGGRPNELAQSIAHDPEAIANNVYANRMGNGDVDSGDGWLYCGRGPIGITGEDMYRKCGEALGIDLVSNPELLEQIDDACFESAAWYFVNSGCIKQADIGNFDGTCDLVNLGHVTPKVGDSIGYAERYAYYKRLRSLYGA